MKKNELSSKIGVREFFIAQKAGKKLREFAANYYARLAAKERDNAERLERGEILSDD